MNAFDEWFVLMHLMKGFDECIDERFVLMHLMKGFDECI
jgi:hypothetical protein